MSAISRRNGLVIDRNHFDRNHFDTRFLLRQNNSGYESGHPMTSLYDLRFH